MKKLAAIAALAVAAAAHAEIRIATVDMVVLMKNHPSYESNRKLLSDTQSDSEKRLAEQKKRLDAIEAEANSIAEEYRNPMLAAAAKARIEEKLADVQKRYAALSNKIRTDVMNDQRSLSDLEASLFKTQAEDLKTIVSKYAKENGYDIVLSAEAVVYSVETVDITANVLGTMGVDPAKARGREDAADEGK